MCRAVRIITHRGLLLGVQEVSDISMEHLAVLHQRGIAVLIGRAEISGPPASQSANLIRRYTQLPRLCRGVPGSPATFDPAAFNLKPFPCDEFIRPARRLVPKCRRSKGSGLQIPDRDLVSFRDHVLDCQLYAIAVYELTPHRLDLLECSCAFHTLDLGIIG